MAKISQNRNTCKGVAVKNNIKNVTKNVTKEKDIINPFDYLIKDQPKTIDSLKIRIPIEQVTILNEILGDEYYVFSKTTGEEITDESFKKNAYFHELNGCKTYYKIEKQNLQKGAISTYLTILLTSKILGNDYFKGLQKSTALQVYDKLMEQKVISMSFQSFMLSECTDTDIKIDLLPSAPVIKIVKELFKLVKPKKRAIEGCSIYTKKDNLGIQFALRKTSRYINCPYLKFYEKVRELKYHSEEFYKNNFLGLDLPKEILRIETTIKNKNHFKHFKQTSTKLFSVLENLQNIGTLAFKKAFESHLNVIPEFIEPDIKEIGAELKLAIKDRIIHHAIKKNMEMGLPYNLAVEAVMMDCTVNKSERYKLKKQIQKIFKIKGSPQVEKGGINIATFRHVSDMISGGFEP